MIIDSLSNAHLYTNLNPRFKRAFEFLHDIANLPVGKHMVDGERIYVGINEYTTKGEGEGKWEAHRRYIDIQFMIQGSEKIGYASLSRMQAGEYEEAKDFLPLSGEGEFLTLNQGYFMVLFPEDAHKPSMAGGTPMQVKKAVVKIAVD